METRKKFDWTVVQHLGLLGFLAFLHPYFRLFFLFYLIGVYEIVKKARTASKGLPDGRTVDAYYKTMLLSQLNPLTMIQALAQVFGQVVILLKNPKGLPNAGNYTNKANYRLPFDGVWTIINGGSRQDNSHSWDILTQRYAYDFVITDAADKSYANKGESLTDYYCYGQPVLSPADGEVVRVSNRVKDHTKVGDYSIDWKTNDFRGNFVVIKHAPREYSFIAHFKKDSILVRKGDKVKQGQPIGLCGNSGHSTEPHIHYHLQDHAVMWIATGLPIRFNRFQVVGQDVVTMKVNDFVEKDEQIKNEV